MLRNPYYITVGNVSCNAQAMLSHKAPPPYIDVSKREQRRHVIMGDMSYFHHTFPLHNFCLNIFISVISYTRLIFEVHLATGITMMMDSGKS